MPGHQGPYLVQYLLSKLDDHNELNYREPHLLLLWRTHSFVLLQYPIQKSLSW